MRKVPLTDTLVYEYTQYEWNDQYGDHNSNRESDLIELKEQAVKDTAEHGKRFFQVLAKPDDELLIESKPENIMYLDTWKYQARLRAENVEGMYGVSMALFALQLRLAGGSIITNFEGKAVPEDLNCDDIFIAVMPMAGYGKLSVAIPLNCLEIFEQLPEYTGPNFAILPVTQDDVLEAAFLQDIKAVNGVHHG